MGLVDLYCYLLLEVDDGLLSMVMLLKLVEQVVVDGVSYCLLMLYYLNGYYVNYK